jgi:hypothetical protein
VRAIAASWLISGDPAQAPLPQAALVLDADQIERHARALGFKVARRNMRYERLTEPA